MFHWLADENINKDRENNSAGERYSLNANRTYCLLMRNKIEA
jgi:hypothetical protein